MKLFSKLVLTGATTVFGLWAPVVHAQTTASPLEMTEAEVRKIDLDAGKITLKHGAIKSMDMPGMTMVFVAKEKASLENLKPGDKIKFNAAKEGSNFVATQIEVLR